MDTAYQPLQITADTTFSNALVKSSTDSIIRYKALLAALVQTVDSCLDNDASKSYQFLQILKQICDAISSPKPESFDMLQEEFRRAFPFLRMKFDSIVGSLIKDADLDINFLYGNIFSAGQSSILYGNSLINIFLKKYQLSLDLATMSEMLMVTKCLQPSKKKISIKGNHLFGIPFFLFSVMKSEKWVLDRIHLIQVSPNELEERNYLSKIIGCIEKVHSNMASVHLLKALIYQNKADFKMALDCVNEFIVLSQSKFNDLGEFGKRQSMDEYCLSTIDRMTSLICGRLCRLQRNFDLASEYLEECMTLAQTHKDDEVLCMGIAEMQIFLIEAGQDSRKFPKCQALVDKLVDSTSQDEPWFFANDEDDDAMKNKIDKGNIEEENTNGIFLNAIPLDAETLLIYLDGNTENLEGFSKQLITRSEKYQGEKNASRDLLMDVYSPSNHCNQDSLPFEEIDSAQERPASSIEMMANEDEEEDFITTLPNESTVNNDSASNTNTSRTVNNGAHTGITHVNNPTTSTLTSISEGDPRSSAIFINPLEHHRQAECFHFISNMTATIRKVLSGNPTDCQIICSDPCNDWTRLNDPYGYSQILLDTAESIKSSVMLHHGHLTQVVQMSRVLDTTNQGDCLSKKHMTEAYATLKVNEAYALAINFHWKEAFESIRLSLKMFHSNADPLCLKHLKTCYNLLHFDYSMFMGAFEKSALYLNLISNLNVFEYTIRYAIYSASTKRLVEAIDKLLEIESSVLGELQVINHIRWLVVIGGLYTRNNQLMQGQNALRKALELANGTGSRPLINMVSRRLALTLIEKEMFDEALVLLNSINEYKLNLRGIEKALFPALMVYYYVKSNQTARDDLIQWLWEFTHESERLGIMLWVKEALRLTVHFYEATGQIACRNEIANAFLHIHQKYPQELDWKLF